MPEDRHPVEWMQCKMFRLAHHRFKILEGVGHILKRQDQPDDVDIGASRKTIDDRIGHVVAPSFALPSYCQKGLSASSSACCRVRPRSLSRYGSSASWRSASRCR